MKKIICAIAFSLAFVAPCAAIASEEEIIDAVERAFIAYHRGMAESVEYNGEVLSGRKLPETVSDLSGYVSNKWGYLDRLKEHIRMHGHAARKYRFHRIDIVRVDIDMDSAVVEAEVYADTIQPGKTGEIVRQGGNKHSINLAWEDNLWKIIWDYDQAIPEGRP